jgi:hypothetical protein
MGQIHKWFTSQRVRFLFQAYFQGKMNRTGLQEALGIGKSRFFSLLKEYRQASETFSVSYECSTPPRVSPTTDAEIKYELLREKKQVEDPQPRNQDSDPSIQIPPSHPERGGRLAT